MQLPLCSFIIVTFNNAASIELCLRSIAEHTRLPFDIIIIDNSPGNQTVLVIEEYARTHSSIPISLLRQATNIGFARACNLGARQTRADYLFFLNPDTELCNDVASHLMRYLQDNLTATAVGPAIYDSHGKITRTSRNLPTPLRIFCDITGLDKWLGVYKLLENQHRGPQQVQQIIGAALFIKRRDYDHAGGMDEQFFVYFEEVDLCKRLRTSGGQIWFYPAGHVRHLAGTSCEVAGVRARMIFTLRESRKKYFRKHHGRQAALLVDSLNRIEGVAKSVVLFLSSVGKRSAEQRERLSGFWSVVMGTAPLDVSRRLYRVLAFTVKPMESPDSRYRVLQYLGPASADGVEITHRSLLGKRYYDWQTRDSHLIARLALLPVLVVIRLWQVLFIAPQYDAVWVLREMFPLGPEFLERLLFWKCKRVILDIDDALHVSDEQSARFLPRLLRDQQKFGRVAASCSSVVCGNRYLATYYQHYSTAVRVMPTVIDADRYDTCSRSGSPVARIGWIGTPLNKHHLDSLEHAFQVLATERDFELVVVGLNQPLRWGIPRMRHMKWDLAHELRFFGSFDIGIMPLEDSPFARGKCAFKLVQYMGAGLPVVASPVGMNAELVQHGTNGYLATTEAEWISSLRDLIDKPLMRETMGRYGRSLVREQYSLQVAWPRYSAILTGGKR